MKIRRWYKHWRDGSNTRYKNDNDFHHCHWIGSLTSIIVSYFTFSFLLPPWRWPHKWPKHVGSYGIKTISVVCILLVWHIIYSFNSWILDHAKISTFCRTLPLINRTEGHTCANVIGLLSFCYVARHSGWQTYWTSWGT